MFPKPSTSSKHLPALILCLSIIVAFLTALPLFTINQANASPIVYENIWKSRPGGQTSTGFGSYPPTTPNNSFDNSNSTYTQINYVRAPSGATYDLGLAAGGASFTKAFKIPDVRSAPLPYIAKVDIVIRWEAESNTKSATYQILFNVAGGTFTSLAGPSDAAKALSTDIYSFTQKPGGGAWTWTDINRLVVRFTNPVGSKTADGYLRPYEVWLNVVVKSSPKIFVDIPGGVNGNLTDITKVIDSTFSVAVKVENISNLFGPELRLRFDPETLSANPQWTYGDLFPTEPSVFQNITDNDKGLVWIAVVRNPGEPGVCGSGTFINVSFKVKGIGETTLNIYATVLGDMSAVPMPHDIADGYFRNIAMPYSATMQAIAPAGSQSSPFVVDINITKSTGQSGAFGVYSWEFNMTYDKTKFEATLVTEGGYLKQNGVTTFHKTINNVNGWVWANASLNGDLPGVFGNGTIAQINFNVLTPAVPSLLFLPGKERLTKYNYGTGIPGVGDGTIPPAFPNPLPGTNPFSNLPVTAIPGAVPEFPLGAAIELALIPVIIFVWFKVRRRKTPEQQ